MSNNTTSLRFLQQLVGTWSFEWRTTDDSDHPGATARGTETVRAIGDHFVVLDNHGTLNDGSASQSATLIGYEPEEDRLTGAVATTAVPVLFVYRGELSTDGRILCLETEGPAMTEGRKTDRYRDVLELVNADRRVTSAQVLLQDGQWKEFMRTELVRQR
jgi:Protein of unknown function (DUF1579)